MGPGHSRLTELLEAPDFAASVDKQQAALQVVAAAAAEGGRSILWSPWGVEAITAIARRLDESPDRIRAILETGDLISMRRALKRRGVLPGERLPHERVYPTSGWLGAYLDSNLATEQPLAWHFWAAVAVLGAACRRSVYVDSGYHGVLFPANYVFLVGPTGHGKSQVIHRATGILEAANAMALPHCVTAGVDHRVVVANVVTAQSAVDLLKPGPVYPPEVPGARIDRRESIGVIANAEAATLLGRGRREVSDQLVPFLTDAYDGEARLTATRGRGEARLAATALTLLLGSTAEWLRTSMTEAVFYGGFTGRCLFVERHTRDRLHYRDIPGGWVPDPVIERELARLLVPWLLTSPIELSLTPEATDWYGRWYVEHRESTPPTALLGPWWERKPAHLLKLASTLAVSEHTAAGVEPSALSAITSFPLRAEWLATAATLLEVEEAGMAGLFEEIEQAPDTAVISFIYTRLERLWEAGGNQPVPHFEWYRAVRQRVGTNVRFRQLAASLVESGEVVVQVVGRGQVYAPRARVTQ